MERLMEGAILEPLSETEPAGPHLFYTEVFDQIREAIREDNPNLSQGVWQTEMKQANWPEARQLCREVLAGRSRDLRVAIWHSHAAIELDGADGLLEGLQIIDALSKSFRDSLHPTDPEHRVAAYEWMDRSCALRAKSLPVCLGDDGARVTWAEREMFLFLERKGVNSDDAKDGTSGYVSREQITAGIRSTPTAFYRESTGSVKAALSLCEALRERLDGEFGKDAPGFTELRALLGEMHSFFHGIWREREPEIETEEYGEPEAAGGAEAIVDEQAVVIASHTTRSPIRSRPEAYARLREVADYLFRAEPHSPAPYLIQRAISWGDMTLSELLLEILRDHQDIRQVYSLLGITEQLQEEAQG